MNHKLLLFSLFSAIPVCVEADVIVSETFGGTGAALNGSSADTFDAAILSQGGAVTGNWQAAAHYFDDGTVTAAGGATDGGAGASYLVLGDYIMNSRGTANGIFTLETTMEVTAGTTSDHWISVGFLNANVTTGTRFYDNNVGYGTSVLRADDASSSNFYVGPGANGTTDDPGILTGPQTFTVTLDLSTWNGTDDHGSIAFSLDGGVTTELAYSFNGDPYFYAIGFTNRDNVDATISSISLTQIPEPGTSGLLAGCLGLGYVMARRRRTGRG